MKGTLRLAAIFGLITVALSACMPPSAWFVPNSQNTTSTSAGSTAIGTNSSTITSADIETTGNESSLSSDTTNTGFETATGASSGTGSSGGSATTSTAAGTTKSTGKSSSGTTSSATTSTKAPSTNSEFRGVWVSYIELGNMLKGKSVADAKSAIDRIMNNAKSYRLNAVIFHVRANSDAYYKSTVFKTATNVQALLNAGFDPLAYAVQAAHSRGLELHAWINPYRVGTDTSFAKSTDYFLSSDGRYYYNPSSSAVQKLILDGIAEITRNYDVDGVQFDDYFYPSSTTVVPPSSPATFEKTAYNAYTSAGGKLSIADWRRAQVSALVASAYAKVHSTRSGCVFGISPRGVQSQNYSIVYADVATWMAKPGYVDYISPQIYFGFLNSKQPYESTVQSWISMNRHSSVKLYVGLALYKTGMASDENAGTGKTEWATHDDIMKRSIQFLRTRSACSGMMFYSYSYFSASSGVTAREVSNLLSVL